MAKISPLSVCTPVTISSILWAIGCHRTVTIYGSRNKIGAETLIPSFPILSPDIPASSSRGDAVAMSSPSTAAREPPVHAVSVAPIRRRSVPSLRQRAPLSNGGCRVVRTGGGGVLTGKPAALSVATTREGWWRQVHARWPVPRAALGATAASEARRPAASSSISLARCRLPSAQARHPARRLRWESTAWRHLRALTSASFRAFSPVGGNSVAASSPSRSVDHCTGPDGRGDDAAITGECPIVISNLGIFHYSAIRLPSLLK
jgi:hypothetical protein